MTVRLICLQLTTSARKPNRARSPEKYLPRRVQNGIVASANYNSPGQTVIAGEVRAVDEPSGYLRDAGSKRVVPPAVSVPSHCRLMDPASRSLGERLNAITIQDPGFAVVGHADARPKTHGASLKQTLVRQPCKPLLWEDSVRFTSDEGVDAYIGAGPGKVLPGPVRRILAEATEFSVQDRETLKRTLKEISG